jgi:glycosyltransferase involved in cell wall biosynthesis
VTSARRPRVSVCVCAYNDAGHVRRAIDSALAQTYGELEVVVVDDASTDGTFEVAGGYRDPRVRLFRNDVNIGNARNRSRAAKLAEGEFVKYVDQDDWLAPDCVDEHLRLFDQRPALGFTFSRRELCLDDDRSPPALAWRQRYAELQRAFGALKEINDGSALLEEYLTRGFGENWIGEPTSVMIRKAGLHRTGLFNRFVRQAMDMDLWLRQMAFFEVGFVDAVLCTRRVADTSETVANMSERRGWLDRLWMLEGLAEIPEIWQRYPALRRMRRDSQKSMFSSFATGRYRNRRLTSALSEAERYLAHRTRRRFGMRGSVYDVLG